MIKYILAVFNLLVLHMTWFSGVWSVQKFVRQFVVLHSEGKPNSFSRWDESLCCSFAGAVDWEESLFDREPLWGGDTAAGAGRALLRQWKWSVGVLSPLTRSGLFFPWVNAALWSPYHCSLDLEFMELEQVYESHLSVFCQLHKVWSMARAGTNKLRTPQK